MCNKSMASTLFSLYFKNKAGGSMLYSNFEGNPLLLNVIVANSTMSCLPVRKRNIVKLMSRLEKTANSAGNLII